MSNLRLDILADVEDTMFKNGQQWVAKIVDAGHKYDTVELNLTEGPTLEQITCDGISLLDLLKKLCESNQWPLSKFHLTTMNLVQDRQVWPSIGIKNLAGHFLSCQGLKKDGVKNIRKTFGMFIGRSSWDRLYLASHLFNEHRDISLQTYRTYLNDPGSAYNIDIDRLYWHASAFGKLNYIGNNLIGGVAKFITHLPILIDNNHPGQTHLQWDSGAVGSDILGWYDNIFVDLVCEKMISGKNFFPTEKTARPLATKTPFIVMGAPNFLSNLRRLGFKTFDGFWNEDYDYQQGFQRATSIKIVLDQIAKMDTKQINSLQRQMQPILDHNFLLYNELTSERIQETYK